MIIQAETQNIDIQLVTETTSRGATIIPETLNEVRIQGAIVDIKGKTDLKNFEVNDRFRYWTEERYVQAKILSLPVTLPDDLDDKNKINIIAEF
jgi:hypothetical protein